MTSARRYATADDAAIAALNEANPRSIRENKEYGGLIFRDGAGYGFTPPRVGGPRGFSLVGIRPPPGATEVGNYHCHGDYSTEDAEGFDVRGTREEDFVLNQSDVFGPNDLPTARSRGLGVRGYRAYLGTPRRVFLYYDVDTRWIGKLRGRVPRRN